MVPAQPMWSSSPACAYRTIVSSIVGPRRPHGHRSAKSTEILSPEINPHEDNWKAAGIGINRKLLRYLAGYALLGDLNRARSFYLDLNQLTVDVWNRKLRLQINAEVLVLSPCDPVTRRIDKMGDQTLPL